MSDDTGLSDSGGGPQRIEGWLMTWDASDDQTAKLRLFGTTAPPIPWEPSFCVLREDVKTLTFHKQEEGADELPGLVVLRKKRLDDGKQEFDKRWGFETLKSIQENARQHQDEHLLHPPQACMRNCQSAEELFYIERSSPKPARRLQRLTQFFGVSCPLDKFSRSPILDTFNDSMPDTSYEKLSDRRGSEPLVSSSSIDLRADAMDTSSTPSKIANFFMKKGFKSSNLKRTKSVTKLDNRKRSASHVMDSNES